MVEVTPESLGIVEPPQQIDIEALSVGTGENVIDFKLTSISRGASKGWKYFAPVLPKDRKEAFRKLVSFYTEDKILEDILLPALNTRCQRYTDECEILEKKQVLDKKTGKMVEVEVGTGRYNWEAFGPMFSRLSARGDSVATIKNNLLKLGEQLNFIDWSDKDKAALEVQELVARMNSLRSDLEAKRRKTAEDLAAEAEGTPVPATV